MAGGVQAKEGELIGGCELPGRLALKRRQGGALPHCSDIEVEGEWVFYVEVKLDGGGGAQPGAMVVVTVSAGLKAQAAEQSLGRGQVFPADQQVEGRGRCGVRLRRRGAWRARGLSGAERRGAPARKRSAGFVAGRSTRKPGWRLRARWRQACSRARGWLPACRRFCGRRGGGRRKRGATRSSCASARACSQAASGKRRRPVSPRRSTSRQAMPGFMGAALRWPGHAAGVGRRARSLRAASARQRRFSGRLAARTERVPAFAARGCCDGASRVRPCRERRVAATSERLAGTRRRAHV